MVFKRSPIRVVVTGGQLLIRQRGQMRARRYGCQFEERAVRQLKTDHLSRDGCFANRRESIPDLFDRKEFHGLSVAFNRRCCKK